jgi:phosphopantothenoylcysteine synthetase/decarboxylase
MAVIAAFAFVVRAEEDPQKSEAADAQKRMDAMFAGMTKFVGDTRLNEKGVKSVLEHWKSFDAVGDGEDEDNEIEKALEESFRKSGAYDFGIFLNHPKFKKWAATVGVDGPAWLKQYMRGTMILMRADLLANYEQLKAQMKVQLAELEKMKAQLGETQYAQVKAAMEQSMANMESMAKAAKRIPEPDKAEQELLKKYGDKLRATMGDDDEDMEDDDDGGEDDDDGGEDDDDR